MNVAVDIPFIYNTYVTGKNFIGRKKDTVILSNLLDKNENIALYGAPKTGKMSLLKQTFYEMKLAGKSFEIADVSLLDVRTSRDFIRRLGDCIIRLFATTPQEFSDIIGFNLAGTHFVFDPDNYSDKDEILSLNWDMDEEDQLAVLRLPYLLAMEKKRQIFVLIREFQNTMFFEDGETILKMMEQVFREASFSQGEPSCSFIMTGSRVNAMKDIFENRKFFYRITEKFRMTPIEEGEIADHIIKVLLSNGKVIEREPLLGACKLLKSNIWYINHFVSICDHLSKGYVTEITLITALDSLVSIHEPKFEAMVNDLTTFQVSLLKAVIDGHTKFSSTEVIARYSLNSSANVKRVREALVKKEIITFNDNDQPEIIDPLFEYWVRKYFFHKQDGI